MSRVRTEDLMRYLDGEMSPEERARTEAELARSTELQRELALYESLKADIQGLSFHPVTYRASVWDRVNARVNRPVGWGFLVVGLTMWLGYGSYVFATSSVSRWQKLGTGGVAIGILVLLASVIWERLRDLETDPYRDVHR